MEAGQEERDDGWVPTKESKLDIWLRSLYFLMQRQQSKEIKQRKLMAHTKRGSDHSFYFHEGDVILCRKDESSLKKYPKETRYILWYLVTALRLMSLRQLKFREKINNKDNRSHRRFLKKLSKKQLMRTKFSMNIIESDQQGVRLSHRLFSRRST